MSLAIQIRDHKTAFSPRERVAGDVSWQLDAPPKSVELRLLWSTDGRGLQDESVVETIPFASPQATESRPFAITLPDGPYSFSGALITLRWELELTVLPGNQTTSVGIIVAPGGEAVSLPRTSATSG
ncbi:MAG: hypothetical protein P4L99_15050 [Chthoniobacter sp.]|nr:hypothetical protein [Chthoniobacter sp.]